MIHTLAVLGVFVLGLFIDREPDPTPWCLACGARKAANCKCGPIAENE